VRRGLCLGLLAVLLLGTPAEAAGAKKRETLSGVVNLNAATAEQLDLLPGVGPKVAQAVLVHRQKRPFRRVEELVRVKGFGRKRLRVLMPYLAVSGETTLRRVAPGKEVAPR
jgi:competence protein ComEA